MKKLLCTLLTACLLAGLSVPPVQATVGDVIGTVCWSDITAKIDGRTIPSYNWEGSTVVPAELLGYYGMQIGYNWDQRELRINWAPDGERSGTYTPPEDRPAAGTPAYDILETDIVTYVQGKPVQGLNIGGTTMVRLPDLADCGTLTWDPVDSVAELTLFEDLPSLERDRVIAELEAQAEALGGSCAYEVRTAEGPMLRQNKTVVVGRVTLPDGTVQSSMTCIYGNGRVLDVVDLLPEAVAARLDPQIRELDSSGIQFVTPSGTGEGEVLYEVRWGGEWEPGTAYVQQEQSLDQPLEQWEAELRAQETVGGGAFGEAVFRRDYDQVVGEWVEASDKASFTLDQDGWKSVHVMTGSWEYESGWGRAWDALWGLAPGPWDEDYDPENSPELRQQVSQYLKITCNGQPVTGDLTALSGNGHQDLSFTFDQPIAFAQGDEIRVWVGLPEEN